MLPDQPSRSKCFFVNTTGDYHGDHGERQNCQTNSEAHVGRRRRHLRLDATSPDDTIERLGAFTCACNNSLFSHYTDFTPSCIHPLFRYQAQAVLAQSHSHPKQGGTESGPSGGATPQWRAH